MFIIKLYEPFRLPPDKVFLLLHDKSSESPPVVSSSLMVVSLLSLSSCIFL